MAVDSAAPPTPARGTIAAASDQLTQVSVINALMLGQYDGIMPIGELLKYGDFGLGTCDHLDGELIVLDGRAWQVRSDGSVKQVGPQESTPFASVTPFAADGRFAIPAVESLKELEAALDKKLPGPNTFVAIRIEVQLRSVTLRSVPRQEPPYQPLADVAKRQTMWNRQNVKGTFVGLRCPAWTGGLNVPGYHWHFLSADHQVGGHVIDCQVKEGEAAYDGCDAWLIKLSDLAAFQKVDLGRNLSRELESVERSRGE